MRKARGRVGGRVGGRRNCATGELNDGKALWCAGARREGHGSSGRRTFFKVVQGRAGQGRSVICWQRCGAGGAEEKHGGSGGKRTRNEIR